jgi:acyl-CoA reductase-like NAD-dependent aldehyde dehydrogenase
MAGGGRDPGRVDGAGAATPAGPAEVAAAVVAARRGQEIWASLTPGERRDGLGAVKRALVAAASRIVEVVASETGKSPVDVLETEVLPAAVHARYLARTAHLHLAPRRINPLPVAHKRAWLEYRPLGVAGVISPWNFPFFLSLQPALTALAAGCGVVLKPSSATPGSGALVAELAAAAGLPDGLVQVVQGGPGTGRALVAGGVDVVSFTGSSVVGREVVALAAAHLVPTLLELGGKHPMVVLGDAHPVRAARGAVWAGFLNAGQACVAVERVYVVAEAYDAFVAALGAAVAEVEASSHPARGIGPVFGPGQMEAVEAQVAAALAAGATVLAGGKRVGQSYYEPTVLLDVDHSMAVMCEETFGPVLPVMRVADEEEAIARANDSPYGLHASVWAGDAAAGRRVAGRLRAGTVAINDALVNYGIPALPFGGVGASGWGRTGGAEGLRAFSCQVAVTETRWRRRREPYWFPRRGGMGLRLRLLRLLAGR